MARKAELCPCGSQASYKTCCEPLITGKARPETAEQLMRSRYTAYTKGAMSYLYETTHPSHREGYDHEGTREWAENSEWQGLEIIATTGGGENDTVGEVEFKASYATAESQHIHHEIGKFLKTDGAWYFTDGKMAGQMPIRVDKIGRNDPCRCGSGKKFKKCCGA